MSNNLYIQHGSVVTFPPPWRAENVEISVIYLKADLDKLTALCDKTLNKPSNNQFKFRPTTDYVLLTFQNINKIWSQDKDYKSAGFIDELEASFWVFVEDEKNPDERMYVPYMFTNNGLAVLTGREVFGFPKEFAEVRIGGAEIPYTVTALSAIKSPADATSRPPLNRIKQREIVRVEKKSSASNVSWKILKDKTDVLRCCSS